MSLTNREITQSFTVMYRCPKTRRLSPYRKTMYYFDGISLPVLVGKDMKCDWGMVPAELREQLLISKQYGGPLKPVPANTIM